MKTKISILVVAAVIAFAMTGTDRVLAGNRAGTVSAQFLKIPTSARAIGMGGAAVAVADGVNSIAYNPAGILSISNIGAGVTYTSWFADIQADHVLIVP